ncbi:MAG: ABC transporter ATP-binding protein [bacterium]|nr:ABC transporter ATP-binding protein [bacterium]
MHRITKRFGAVIANDAVDIEISPGEIHALVGENGAGKTTLMNILYGLLRPDSGEIDIDGKPTKLDSPATAIKNGIGMVHQHFMLIPPFTVTENVILGNEPNRFRVLINKLRAKQQVESVSTKYGLKVDPNSKIEHIGVGLEQRVELIKTLYRGARILILDEPTAVLTPQETDELFNILRQFKQQGKTIIFITHKLNEVMELSDRITVMKSGKVVGALKTAETSKEEIARLMVGRDVLFQVKKSPAQPGAQVLEVSRVNAVNNKKLPILKDVSFSIRAGEILGIAGVEGNGQTELVETLTGLRKINSGQIRLFGNNIANSTPRNLFSQHLAHIPEDRIKRGLVLDYTVADNLILGRHWESEFTRFAVLDSERILQNANELINTYDIRPRNPKLFARYLSGGNQQKVIIARELSRAPKLLIASQPTRGLDIGATEFIHQQLISARDKGVAVLLVSADLSEIMFLSDRIAVMYEGRIVGIVDAEKTNIRELGLMMTGVVKAVPSPNPDSVGARS